MALFNYECDETKRIIDEVSPNYPQLTTYEKEWLYFHKYGYIPGVPVELEYEKVVINPYGSVKNAIPFKHKSAILKGQTLVNLSEIKQFSLTGPGTTKDTGITNMFKPNTKYTRIVYITKNTLTGANSSNQVAQCQSEQKTDTVCYDSATFGNITLNSVGLVQKKLFTTPNDMSTFNRISAMRIYGVNTGGTLEGYEIIIEGDYTKWDIPYFEGMQSVNMPVLITTTGKNLFDGHWETGSIGNTNGNNSTGTSNIRSRNYISVKPNTTYIASSSQLQHKNVIVWYAYNEDKKFISYSLSSNSFKTPSNCKFIRVRTYEGDSNNISLNCILQIEEGSVATSYEPFKSNILTINEEVTLRGIGDVKDELNLLTGELTQRIGEIVLDGSDDENWVNRNNGDGTNTITFQIPFDVNKHNEIIADKFALSQSSSDGIEGFGYASDVKMLYIEIKRDRLNNVNVDKFKQWLSQNPITVQYSLTTESVKTVDLEPLTNPYEGTNHYEITSDIPCQVLLDVPVVSTGKQTLQEINN